MEQIKINIEKRLHSVSPMLYGIFFEDINYAGDGGLYAELIANRSFSYADRSGQANLHHMCWEAIGGADFEIRTKDSLNQMQKHYAFLGGPAGAGLKNTGFCKEGFAVKQDGVFRFSCYARTVTPHNLCIRICDSGGVVCASKELFIQSPEWSCYEIELTSEKTAKNAFLELLLTAPGEIELGFVSLFPKDTYRGRENGMRRDIAEMIEELSPKFMRFPGGCIVEGRSFENMYRWKDTIGSLIERKTNWNRWQLDEYQPGNQDASDYFQSYGLGYYEYFLLCEDLGAKPVPVMNAGMTCQWHEGLLADLEQLGPWIQDVLDLIEFANGDGNSEWGRKRIALGHEKPFGLEYIAIGNEQWGEVYFERYEAFQKVLAETYPHIKLITSAGWTSEGKDFDTAVQWMKRNKDKAYAVDEHFYQSPEWFLDNITRYDGYDRTLPKVFAGEYAAHNAKEILERKNNWYTALAEAAFLTGVEKNSDHVVMTCYAPLLARTGRQQWQPDLIWFDNDSVYGTPNYYVQKLFSNCTGDVLVESLNNAETLCLSSSVTSDGGRLFIKIVNTGGLDKTVRLDIGSAVLQSRIHTLHAALEAENSHENPRAVYPVVTEQRGFQEIQQIKGHSVTVFELVLQ